MCIFVRLWEFGWEDVCDGCAAFLVFRLVSERILKGKGTSPTVGRMEGKDYVMEDGDVVEFRFNV